MSAAALAWAWRQPTADHGTKVVLLKLADQANDDGECWPSRRTIAADCAMSMATVTRKIAALRDAGILQIEQRARVNGSRTSNLYRLSLIPHPPTQDEQGAYSPCMSRPEPHLNLSEPNGSAHKPDEPDGAQALVAHFVDESNARGAPPPGRVKGQLAREVGTLLREGQSPERVRAGIDRLLERGLHPAALPAAVHEVALSRARDGPKPGRVTGWRFVRGSHGSTYVEDPTGTDVPPRGFA